MPTTVRYEPPSESDWQALLNKPQIGTALARTAARGKAFAETISQEFRDTGEYLGSFDIDHTSLVVGRDNGPRQVVNLVNTAPHAQLVELKHHVLSRTRDFLNTTP